VEEVESARREPGFANKRACAKIGDAIVQIINDLVDELRRQLRHGMAAITFNSLYGRVRTVENVLVTFASVWQGASPIDPHDT
jgi:hypothetical protein